MAGGFVPLRVRSHGSLLHGTASPEALVQRALELDYRALALTDRDNLYLAIRFYQRARAEGLVPLLEKGGKLVVAIDDPLKRLIADQLQFMLGLEVSCALSGPSALRPTIRQGRP